MPNASEVLIKELSRDLADSNGIISIGMKLLTKSNYLKVSQKNLVVPRQMTTCQFNNSSHPLPGKTSSHLSLCAPNLDSSVKRTRPSFATSKNVIPASRKTTLYDCAEGKLLPGRQA
ncbi:hypothetical protein AVEN_236820-1 [Araneus ventricosus]|uniref:Uncharacterized protein n=1 Tax=Araneus ventricosus TaxID=182803 RepID=A0A4Y2DZ97_ARAVE|nr:hypothetical protein AVEN_236820-1 [Araneus ventricosus]